MSGSVDITIITGEDWGMQLTWLDVNGDPYIYSDPIMNIRQDMNTSGKLIAKLDSSGQWDGTLTITAPGTTQARMTSEQTNKLTQSYGFWDLFVTMNGSRIRLAFGTASIAPHVTELS